MPMPGTLLCFLHADSRPPSSLVSIVRQTLSDGRTVMGGFRVLIKHQGRLLHWMTFHQLIKTYYAPLLLRPLSFARCKALLISWILPASQSTFRRAWAHTRVFQAVKSPLLMAYCLLRMLKEKQGTRKSGYCICIHFERSSEYIYGVQGAALYVWGPNTLLSLVRLPCREWI